jgi:hypothetical protein
MDGLQASTVSKIRGITDVIVYYSLHACSLGAANQSARCRVGYVPPA